MVKKLIVIISTVLSLAVLCASLLIYIDKCNLTDVGYQLSSDNRYEVAVQMVGSPEWPFGPTRVRVTVRETDSDKTVKRINTSIANDGVALSEYNYSVMFNGDYVVITLMGCEQAEEVYTVQLK